MGEVLDKILNEAKADDTGRNKTAEIRWQIVKKTWCSDLHCPYIELDLSGNWGSIKKRTTG